MVVVEKPNGSLRICLSPKAIKREHYHMPTADDIFGEMKGAKFFTKMDASNAYWQIVVDEESSKLLTIKTHLGDTISKDNHLGYTARVRSANNKLVTY